jgi:hypothetical protein
MIRVDNGRQRIQFDRPFGLGDGLIKSAKAVEWAVAIPLCRGISSSKSSASLSLRCASAL